MERRLQLSIASEMLLITSSSAKTSRNKKLSVMKMLSMKKEMHTSYIHHIIIMEANIHNINVYSDDVKNKTMI
jgi:hypothetical protein